MEKKAFKSGATSSGENLPYADIPVSFIRRVAKRFQLGQQKHGRGNWLRSYEIARYKAIGYDVEFLRDRYNHAVEHLLSLKEGTKDDDHIGAVGWFLAFASEAEELGINWKRVLKVRTPEDDEEFINRKKS